jgi:hypothetical protein
MLGIIKQAQYKVFVATLLATDPSALVLPLFLIIAEFTLGG